MSRALRILVTADPYLPVPPRHYGGIERIVDLLVRGLVDRGHAVTLLAHPASQTPARLLPYGAAPHRGALPRLVELAQVARHLWRLRASVDLVHSFGRMAALLPLLPRRSLPKVQSWQRELPVPSMRRALRLAGSSLRFTLCAAHLVQQFQDDARLRRATVVIPNAVEVDRYRFSPSVPADAPLIFLGRLEPIKGVDDAIQIAKASGRSLVIAGNRVEEGSARGYFAREIEPHLGGESVRWVGPVTDEEKGDLLRNAAALLMPIRWEEPFGIVMVEAMACGTPVIGYRRGSVPEVVRQGIDGFVGASAKEAAEAVGRLDRIDRRAVRDGCAARFDAPVVVSAYEALYQEMLGR